MREWDIDLTRDAVPVATFRSVFVESMEVVPHRGAPHITETELAIVDALASGHYSKEIASTLKRSRATIEFHVRALFLKFNARSRAQIVARAFEFGILPKELRQMEDDAGTSLL